MWRGGAGPAGQRVKGQDSRETQKRRHGQVGGIKTGERLGHAVVVRWPASHGETSVRCLAWRESRYIGWPERCGHELYQQRAFIQCIALTPVFQPQ